MADQAPVVPSGPEELTPRWLTMALRTGGVIGQATVSSLETSYFGPGKGATGRLARVGLHYDVEEPLAPTSLIAKFPANPGPTRDLADRFRLYEREARFYQEVAHRVGVPTPRLYYSALDPAAGGFVLLLEDMSPAREGDLLAGCTLEQAKVLLDWLARLHSTWWNKPELDQLPWLPSRNDSATLEFAASMSTRAWKAFRRKYDGHLPRSVLALGERLKRDRTVLDRLAAAPRTLVHGDLRINNLMFADSKGKELCAVIDWQTAVRGRGPIDVAFLLVTSLQPEDRRIAEAELLPRYHRSLEENGVRGYSFEQCWLDYRLTVADLFNQWIALSSLLNIDTRMNSDLAAALSVRLSSALLDLDLIELVPPSPSSRWDRWVSLLRRPARGVA